MKQSTRRFAVRACVAAACGSFALCAAGQSIPDQRQVGLERAIKTPTEIIWLRDEILAELWRKDPRLDDSPARCAEGRNAKQGCTIGNPSAWRYVFGAGSHDFRFRPLTSGVYMISPQAQKTGLVRAPSGAILLAAGTSVTLIDAAYPGIQIELTAPPDQSLPLGNLAAADAGRMFALLARQPGTASASAASVLESGRVALKSDGETQIAAARPVEAAPPKAAAAVEVAMRAPPVRVVEAAQVAVKHDPLEFKGTIDLSRFPSGEEVKLVAEAEARLAREIIARAQAYREQRAAEVPPIQTVVYTGIVNIAAVSARDVRLKLDPGPIAVAAAPEPAAAPPSAPSVQQEVQRIASASPDTARLRAEVEAEIERDRVRVANLQQQACSGIGRPMQGCTVGTPKRFSFAG